MYVFTLARVFLAKACSKFIVTQIIGMMLSKNIVKNLRESKRYLRESDFSAANFLFCSKNEVCQVFKSIVLEINNTMKDTVLAY